MILAGITCQGLIIFEREYNSLSFTKFDEVLQFHLIEQDCLTGEPLRFPIEMGK